MIERQLLWDKIYKNNAQDIQNMYPYIEDLIVLKRAVEKHGIDGFDKFIENATSFEKLAVSLITEGNDPDDCKIILTNVLNSSGFSNIDYLKNLIFCEFILVIQKGSINDCELRNQLFSYLGMDSYKLI